MYLATQLEDLQLTDPATNDIFQFTLSCETSDPVHITQLVEERFGAAALEKLMNKNHVQKAPPVFKAGEVEAARLQVKTALDFWASKVGQMAEIAEAEEDLRGVADESVTWRLSQVAEARNKAERSEHEDKAEYDTADNGVRINRAERSTLDDLLGRINFTKPRR